MSSNVPGPDAPGDREPEDSEGQARPKDLGNSRDLTLHSLLSTAVDREASDLHITVGAPPCLRVGSEIFPIGATPLSSRDTGRLCQQVLTEQQIERFAASHSLRMSFEVRGVARFRGSFFMQRGAMAGVSRVIPFHLPALADLGLPTLAPLAVLRRGLVLVGGPLGSGKSTTVASLLAAIGRDRSVHIVTIEDPVEFLVRHEGASLVQQIEVGVDYPDVRAAFTAAMALDPDVFMISELTGLDAIECAIEAAETGRLVIGASPSRSVPKAIARLVDAYPIEGQARARARVADVLEAVTCQSMPRGEPGRRTVTCEVRAADATLRARVRDGSAFLE